MKHLIVVLALVAACSKEEPPAQKTMPKAPTKAAPKVEAPKVQPAPSTDAAKAALDKSIADTKALLTKKEADMKALLAKAKSDPMNAAQYKAEADKLQKEVADLQAKLDGYVKEAAGK